MTNKSVLQEDPMPSKALKFPWVQYVNPLVFCLVLGAVVTSLFLYYRP